MSISSIILNVVVFIIIILFGLIIARFLSNLSKKIIEEFEINKINTKIKKYAPKIVKYIVYLFTLIIALNTVGIKKIAFQTTATILIILIIITFVLTISDFLPNFIKGLKIKNKYKINQKIKLKNISGKIIKKSLTEIQIKHKNEIIHIPYLMLK